jgi:hypothetical protein
LVVSISAIYLPPFFIPPSRSVGDDGGVYLWGVCVGEGGSICWGLVLEILGDWNKPHQHIDRSQTHSTCLYIRRNDSREAGLDRGWSTLRLFLSARTEDRQSRGSLKSAAPIRGGYGRVYLWGSGFGILLRLESSNSLLRSISEPPIPTSTSGGIVFMRQ